MPTPDTEFYRAGAGAVIVNAAGEILVLERSDVPGAWQLPQGGIEPGEEPEATARREASEETGIPEASLEPLGRHPQPLAYELPPARRTPKTGRGQVHHWFFFRFMGSEETIDPGPGGEFRAWRWVGVTDLPAIASPFRRPVYEALARSAAGLLHPGRTGPAPAP